MAEEEIREDQNTDAHKQFILEKMDDRQTISDSVSNCSFTNSSRGTS